MSSSVPATAIVQYAGFWRRAVALVVDYLFVSAVLFGAFALVALALPSVADLVDLSEFGILSVERTLETQPAKRTEAGDETKTETESIVETTVAGRWTYLHRVIEIATEKKGSTDKPSTSTERIRLDPVTRLEMSGTSAFYYFWIPWLIYAAIMESGARQATLGKMAMGIKVTTEDGEPAFFPRSLARNLLKIVSAITLGIGFAMAGWTRRKQAMHDKITDCLVVVSPQD